MAATGFVSSPGEVVYSPTEKAIKVSVSEALNRRKQVGQMQYLRAMAVTA